ncbi:discoidin domain-containing protein [Clostridium sp.]|uniref:discoidin domain-containing protein n=1 Tax=Clostridium sp. TaxID=1506 RepID=UPI002FC7E5F9
MEAGNFNSEEDILFKEERKFTAVGYIKHIKQEENRILIECESCSVKVIFYKPDMVRIWMDPKKEFRDFTGEIMLAKKDFEIPEIKIIDKDSYYKIQSNKCVIRAYKNSLKFAMYDFRDITCIWEEELPLQYSEKITTQTLKTKEDEYFYGGGVQNGYFSHKNKKIYIENLISHWNDGSVSNPVPFYMSTAGYGAFRNTFKPGVYKFTATTTTTHHDSSFDCFYFYGPSLKGIINGYTELTGKPSLIPRWGFGLGDADCYNTSNTTYTGTHDKPNKSTTLEGLNIAKTYRGKDMPGSWILPNDGYGCGYTNLDLLVKEAWNKYGFRVGLWTENGVEKIAEEVGNLGSRLCKLDVAWVGPGYEFALNAAKTAYEGIENNTVITDDKGTYSERGYVWSVCGWAGTQRYSTVWSGDQSGNFEYIRFHIPTYIGAGLSGMPYIGSDVDGIFGGSAKTQVRDLQWKTFTPILINMSGWSERDKQPWVWGEPYTSINRKYLKLRQRLTPYLYSYGNEAYETGAPIVRGMVWEFPKDNFAKTKNTQYQFMCGKWFLVAPVYEDKEVRDDIYLPQGRWIDYWSGKQYEGGRVINNYSAHLDTLPLLVRAGAIIPMYPESLYDGEVQTNEQNPLTIEVYPSGITSFNLYEDDGHTTLHRQGSFSKTLITSKEEDGRASITVNSSSGTYYGMPFARKYEFIIHTTIDPEKVIFNCGEATGELNKVRSKEEWESTKCCCWYFEPNEKKGVLYVKTKAVPLHNNFDILLSRFSRELVIDKNKSLEIPNVPKNLRITEAEDTSLRLQWEEEANVSYYEVKADGIIYSYLENELIHNGLDFVSIHNYKVRTVNEVGTSQWSEEIVGITLQDKMENSIQTNELSAYATSSIGGKHEALKAVDGEKSSQWISNYHIEKLPQTITIDMAKLYFIEKVIYHPREENSRAVITKYNFYISEDGRRFNKIISEGTWKDDGKPKTIIFEPKKIKSIRIEALESSTPEFPGASAAEINIFKSSGSIGEVLADFTGDGKVDFADLNFVLQYYGAKEGDNDWAYVAKADIDKDGKIGIYDIAYVASLISPPCKPTYENLAKGALKLEVMKEEVVPGEELTINVIGEEVTDLYAFESIINLDREKYELIGVEPAQSLKEMTSAVKEKDGKILISFTNVGGFAGVSGTGVLARIKLRAKLQGKVRFVQESALIVGSNLDIVDAVCNEVTKYNESIFEVEIPRNQLSATATSEQEEIGDGSAESIFDGENYTCWHTPWDKSALLPQSIIVDLGGKFHVSKLRCTPRPKGANGVITSYTIFATDSDNEEIMVAEGNWVDDGKEKYITIKNPTKTTKVRIQANEGNGGYASMVGINIYGLIIE